MVAEINGEKLITVDESIFSAVEMLHGLTSPAGACLNWAAGTVSSRWVEQDPAGCSVPVRELRDPGAGWSLSRYTCTYIHSFYTCVFKFAVYIDVENAAVFVFSGG